MLTQRSEISGEGGFLSPEYDAIPGSPFRLPETAVEGR